MNTLADRLKKVLDLGIISEEEFSKLLSNMNNDNQQYEDLYDWDGNLVTWDELEDEIKEHFEDSGDDSINITKYYVTKSEKIRVYKDKDADITLTVDKSMSEDVFVVQAPNGEHEFYNIEDVEKFLRDFIGNSMIYNADDFHVTRRQTFEVELEVDASFDLCVERLHN